MKYLAWHKSPSKIIEPCGVCGGPISHDVAFVAQLDGWICERCGNAYELAPETFFTAAVWFANDDWQFCLPRAEGNAPVFDGAPPFNTEADFRYPHGPYSMSALAGKSLAWNWIPWIKGLRWFK